VSLPRHDCCSAPAAYRCLCSLGEILRFILCYRLLFPVYLLVFSYYLLSIAVTVTSSRQSICISVNVSMVALLTVALNYKVVLKHCNLLSLSLSAVICYTASQLHYKCAYNVNYTVIGYCSQTQFTTTNCRLYPVKYSIYNLWLVQSLSTCQSSVTMANAKPFASEIDAARAGPLKWHCQD